MNLCSALTAYCFFDNKPEALPVYVEKSKQLELFAYWPYPELESLYAGSGWDRLLAMKISEVTANVFMKITVVSSKSVYSQH